MNALDTLLYTLVWLGKEFIIQNIFENLCLSKTLRLPGMSCALYIELGEHLPKVAGAHKDS